MALLASYILPHCPVAIPEVGRGQERALPKTEEGFEKVAKEIASLHPDTIVIASPHAESYSDYFQIADGEMATGSLQEYGAPQIRFRLHYDDALRKAIAQLASARQFPAGFDSCEKPSLDHGTMVPLYFINREYQNYKIVRLGLSGLPLYFHYKMGVIIADAAKKVGERVVFIASGDMSHCLSKDGIYGYRSEGARYEELLSKSLKSANFGDLLRMDRRLITCAKECGHRAFSMLAGTLDRKAIQVTFYSHEAPFGIGYGIYGYTILGDDGSRAFGELYQSKILFSIQEKKERSGPCVKLAYLTLDQFLNRTEAKKAEIPLFMVENQKGVVVSIYEFGTLRARYGTIFPSESNLAQEIIQNTVKAAKDDSFFDPIDAKEFPYLDVQVDEVSLVEPIANARQLDVEKYGVYVKSKTKSGFALPGDPLITSEEKQIRDAKRDARISHGEKTNLFRFVITPHK